MLCTSSMTSTWTPTAFRSRSTACSIWTMVGARTLRRAQQREQFGIEAPLSWLADHFHGQHGGSLPARTGIEAGRIVVTESFHDHGLARAAVAVYGNRGHACSPGVVNQATEVVERLFRARIEDPAAGFDRSNSLFRWALTEGPPLRASDGQSHCSRGAQSVSSTKGTGLLESTPRSEPQPLSSTLEFWLPPERRISAVVCVARSTSSRCAIAVRIMARVSTSRFPCALSAFLAATASLSDIGAKVTSAYRASTKLPEGRRTKMRERSRGSYFISNLPLQRPTSAVSAEDQ